MRGETNISSDVTCVRQHIAQSAYCSRDIYFQFNKVRSVYEKFWFFTHAKIYSDIGLPLNVIVYTLYFYLPSLLQCLPRYKGLNLATMYFCKH